jgi:hypothetical protein
MAKWEVHKTFWPKKFGWNRSLGDVSVAGRIILKLIAEKYCVKVVDWIRWLRIGSVG